MSLHFGFRPDEINKLYLAFSSCDSFDSRECQRTAANKEGPRVSKLLCELQISAVNTEANFEDHRQRIRKQHALMSFTVAIR
jgi:hypothetical protein